MTELVTAQSFDPPQTAATETLKQAAATYHSRDLTKSANLFLKSWRILHIEELNFISGRFDLLPPWNTDTSKPRSTDGEDVRHPYSRFFGYDYCVDFTSKKLSQEHKARALMSFCTLSDLALVCLSCTGVYHNKNYNWNSLDGAQGYALNINALENVVFGDTTTEDLEFDGKIWPRGSRLTSMFCRRVDEMGWRIKSVNSFSGFAHEIATLGLLQLGIAWEIKDEHLDFKNVVKDSMERILHLAKQKISIEGTVIEGKEEEL